MIKNKLIGITLSGAILLVGSSMVFADTAGDNISSPDNVMPISAPINNEDASKLLESKFQDIKDHWAFDEIVSLEEKGLWEDLSDDFEPGEMITGAEFKVYLDKIFEFETEPDFDFELEENISRMEAAKAIQNSFNAKKLSVIITQMFPIFDDTEDLDPEETSALSFVFNTGIMKGKSEGKFAPDASITKAELAVILDRTLATIEIASSVEEPAPIEESTDESGTVSDEVLTE